MASSGPTKNLSVRNQFLMNKMNSHAGAAELGNILMGLDKSVKAIVDTYDVAVDGGTVAAHTLRAVIPANTLVIGALLVRETAYASAGNAGTLALHLEAADDVLTAVDADTIAAKAWGTCVMATASTHILTTAARTLTATVAVEALTQGKYKIILLCVDVSSGVLEA